MTEKDYFLLFIQMVPIILVWIRLESRLSRLEGRFDMFISSNHCSSKPDEKRHGT